MLCRSAGALHRQSQHSTTNVHGNVWGHFEGSSADGTGGLSAGSVYKLTTRTDLLHKKGRKAFFSLAPYRTPVKENKGKEKKQQWCGLVVCSASYIENGRTSHRTNTIVHGNLKQCSYLLVEGIWNNEK